MNLLRQGFRMSSCYRHTDRETDRHTYTPSKLYTTPLREWSVNIINYFIDEAFINL